MGLKRALCLLLRANDYSTMAVAGCLAIASKFLFRYGGKHFFNPANFGIIAALILTQDAWVSPGQCCQYCPAGLRASGTILCLYGYFLGFIYSRSFKCSFGLFLVCSSVYLVNRRWTQTSTSLSRTMNTDE